jgi:hypothetical protein
VRDAPEPQERREHFGGLAGPIDLATDADRAEARDEVAGVDSDSVGLKVEIGARRRRQRFERDQ